MVASTQGWLASGPGVVGSCADYKSYGPHLDLKFLYHRHLPKFQNLLQEVRRWGAEETMGAIAKLTSKPLSCIALVIA